MTSLLPQKIALIGVEEVTREVRGNGFRFSIRFRAGNPEAIGVPAENLTEVCRDKPPREYHVAPQPAGSK